MGKASRGKQERRAARARQGDTPEAIAWYRHTRHQCLHCGAPRDLAGVWCSRCTREGHRRAWNARRLGTPWGKDPRIKWPTRAEMDAYLDTVEQMDRAA